MSRIPSVLEVGGFVGMVVCVGFAAGLLWAGAAVCAVMMMVGTRLGDR